MALVFTHVLELPCIGGHPNDKSCIYFGALSVTSSFALLEASQFITLQDDKAG